MKDALLEHFALGKDFLHGHARHEHAGLALDDALDNVGNVAALLVAALLGVVALGEQHGVLHEGVAAVLAGQVVLLLAAGGGRRVGAARVDVGPDGEDDGQGKLQLLLGHGQQVHGVVLGLDAEAGAALQGPDPGGLCDFDILDAHAGDGEVLVGGGDFVRHGCGG